MDIAITVLNGSALVPAALALALGPPIALRKYIAVSNLDGPTTVEVARVAPPTKTQSALHAIVILAMEGAITLLLFRGPKSIVNSAFLALGIGWYLSCLFMTLREALGGSRKVVYRDNKGRNVWRRQVTSESVAQASKYGAGIAAVGLTAAAYAYPSPYLTWILAYSIILRYVAGAPNYRFSLRVFLLVTCGYVLLVAACSAIAIPIVSYYVDHTAEKEPKAPVSEPNVTESTLAFLTPFNTVLLAVVPVYLAALCYRFDYHLHLSRTADTESPFIPEMIDTPPAEEKRYFPLRVHVDFMGCPPSMMDTDKPTFSPGVAVPSKAPSGFSKVYYYTVVASWTTVQALTILAVTMLPFLAQSVRRDGGALGVMMFLSFPLSILATSSAVLVVAKARGEVTQLWTYVEAWRPATKQAPPVVLEPTDVPFTDEEKEDAEVEAMLLQPPQV